MMQILIKGFCSMELLALIAVGLHLIFSVGRILNLAYGAYLMLGGYMTGLARAWRYAKLFGVPVAIGLLGLPYEILKYQLIVKTLQGDHVAVEISTLILYVVLGRVSVLVFGDSSKILLPIIPGVVYIAGVPVTYNILAATLASWVIARLYLFIKNTHTGRAMQAVSMDTKGAAISGIVPDHINMSTWAISGGLGALGGVFFASYRNSPTSMWVAPLIMPSVAVVIVGGWINYRYIDCRSCRRIYGCRWSPS